MAPPGPDRTRRHAHHRRPSGRASDRVSTGSAPARADCSTPSSPSVGGPPAARLKLRALLVGRRQQRCVGAGTLNMSFPRRPLPSTHSLLVGRSRSARSSAATSPTRSPGSYIRWIIAISRNPWPAKVRRRVPAGMGLNERVTWHASWFGDDMPEGAPPEHPADGAINLEQTIEPLTTDGIVRLLVSFEVVRQQARTLSEKIEHELTRFGLKPPDTPAD